jgi:hypothetical protein
MAKQQSMMFQQMVERARQSPWFLTPEDQQKYFKIFEHFDQAKSGFLSND